jgi:hypothetical protein
MRQIKAKKKHKRYVIAFSFTGNPADDIYFTGQFVMDGNSRLLNFSKDINQANVFTQRPANYWIDRFITWNDYRLLQDPTQVFAQHNLFLREVVQETVVV